jgi:SAM-dependent methyltransferase
LRLPCGLGDDGAVRDKADYRKTLRPDFGRTADDYRRYRAGFPDSLFDRLQAFEIGLPRQSVVDLGTGTGTLARGFALRGCRVIGIDPAETMLEQARELDREAGVAVDYRIGRAEQTGLPAASIDVACAGQCWHWFDRAAAANEVRRLLGENGKILIVHFDWIPLAGNVVEETERLMEAHNPAWKFGGGTGMYPWWLADLSAAGFADIETFTYDVDVAYSPQAWRGRVRASAAIAASLEPAQVVAFDVELAALLGERFPQDPLLVPHRVFAVVGKRRRA